MTARTAQAVSWILRITITVLFVVMVNKGITREQMGLLGAHLSPLLLAGAVALGLLSLFFQLLRWHAILGIQKFNVSLYRAFAMFVWGNLLAFITPGRVGEFGRAIRLDAGRKADAVLSVAIDKIAAVAATVLFGCIGMGLQVFFLKSRPPDRLTLCMAALVIGVSITAGVILLFSKNRVFNRGRIGSIAAHLRNLTGAAPRYFSGSIIGASLCAQAALLVQTSLILFMFGSASLFENMVIAAQVYAFMLFLPFFIANIGLREYAFGMMIDNRGVGFSGALDPSPVILGVSLLILLINIILPAVTGLIVMLIDKKHRSTV
ncbi:MAG: flippase-like domain-containing protein [Chitinispirillaceae bacterium]|nr:flippase-like domain-containing protein [Chitinispirillaceae bacterium]